MKVNGVEISEQMTYEDMADLFMSTAVGRATGVSREEFLSRLKERYPDPKVMAKQISDSYLQFITCNVGGLKQ